jgi:PAS domain S-box-containing protein
MSSRGHQAEEQARYLMRALERSPNAVIALDLEARVTSWSLSATRLYRYAAHEVLGRVAPEFLTPHARPEEYDRVLQRVRSPEPSLYETKRRTKTGAVLDVEIAFAPIFAEDGAVVGQLSLSRDITERKQAERRLQQQLARLALLHQITRAMGERQDLASIFRTVLGRLERDLPAAFAAIFQGDAGAEDLQVCALGPQSVDLAATMEVAEQSRVAVGQNGVRAALQGQTVYEPDTAQAPFPFPHRFAAAGLRSVVLTPLMVEHTVFGLLVVAHHQPERFSSVDGEFLRQLSEQVAIAAHHAQLYTRLQQAYDDLRQTQQALFQQERLRAVGQMASGIAHDINNAISPASLYVESLLATDATLSGPARAQLTTVQTALADVAQTVGRLRDFYRQPDATGALAAVDLTHLVPQVLELTRARWRDAAQQHGITITVHTDLPDAPLVVRGNESELRDALTNVIFNAVDAMPQGGTLTLTTHTTPTTVVVEVRDTGVGMDAETRQRCVEPFYTTKGARGTGLGLAMVYGAMQRHRGELAIDSAVSHGTTVRLLFPRDADLEQAPRTTATPAARIAPLRILLVDDDPLVRQSLAEILQGDGHGVTVAEGGAAGVAAFRRARACAEAFDVVITDLGMPEVDGRAVARHVKQEAGQTPVLMLTGWEQPLGATGALPPYIDALLSKPPTLAALRTALATVTAPRFTVKNRGRITSDGS